MANYNPHNIVITDAIKIIRNEFVTSSGFTIYIISVELGAANWTVKRRYSEFLELHEQLCLSHKIPKKLFPPKKIFGKQTADFVLKRQLELQQYLQKLFILLTPIPEELSHFLNFPLYEVHAITRCLANQLYDRGDDLLTSGDTFHVSPLQLHAISSRLRFAEPTSEGGDARNDIGHILDFFTQLTSLTITGSNHRIGSSNLSLNQLSFDLSRFKSLHTLHLEKCKCSCLSGLDCVKESLHSLTVHRSLESIDQILLVEEVEREIGPSNSTTWRRLKNLDLSHNKIKEISACVSAAGGVEVLNLEHNELLGLENLQNLSLLSSLSLAHNNIATLTALHTKIGNLRSLDLTDNNISSLQGFSKLYSLESLNLCNNKITQVLEVCHLSLLPCLEQLVLKGNAVANVVEYRNKVLEIFKDRAKEIMLDGKYPTDKEMDTIMILLAIRKSKEMKEQSKVVSAPKDFSSSQPSITPRRDSMSRRRHRAGSQKSSSSPDDGSGVVGSCEGANCDASSVFAPPAAHQFILPETLPGKTDQAFTTYVQSLLPNTDGLTEHSGLGGDNVSHWDQRPLHIMWCPIIAFTNPHWQAPACVFLSSHSMHVFEVQSLHGCHSFPELDHFHCIPLKGIQQIVIGFNELFLRVEEAFAGPVGTVTLLTCSRQKTRALLEVLSPALRAVCQDPDTCEPHITNNRETELTLKAVLNQHENCQDLSQIELLLYMLVHIRGRVQTLVVTKHFIFILNEDYIFSPPPIFGIGSCSLPQFEILQVCPLASRLNGLKIYDGDVESLPEQFTTSPPSSRTFGGFGVKLTLGLEEVNFCTACPGGREKFLSILNKAMKKGKVKRPTAPQAFSARPLYPATPADFPSYPTVELLGCLSHLNEQAYLLCPSSRAMQGLSSMTGEELVNFFHGKISSIGCEGEELLHVLWTSAICLLSPAQEIPACVMLSSRAVYFVSDQSPSGASSWKRKHTRFHSDNLVLQSLHGEADHTAGIIASSAARQSIRCFAQVKLAEIESVNVGIMDQMFRVTGPTENQVISCITRNGCLTESFIKRLMSALSCYLPSVQPAVCSSLQSSSANSPGADVSSIFGSYHSDGIEFVHPSGIRFVYPGEDSLRDLASLLRVQAKQGKERRDVLQYLIVGFVHKSSFSTASLLITASHVCLIREDYVKFPIPKLVDLVPPYPTFHLLEVQAVASLLRVELSDFNSLSLTLIFQEDLGREFCVDSAMEHYCHSDLPTPTGASLKEVSWHLKIQNYVDKDRVLKLLSRLWTEQHEGMSFSVQVSA